MTDHDLPDTEPRPVPRRAGGDSLATIVADRLKRLLGRKRRSFERLAELSGIDIDELLRIESGATSPTLSHLWRIANALGVPLGSLVAAKERQGVLVIRRDEAAKIGSRDGNFISRPLYPYDSSRSVEFYEVVIGPHHTERAEAHAPTTKENIVVVKGVLEIIVGREPPVELHEGDAIDFVADVPHSYRNLEATPALLYMVMSYESRGKDDQREQASHWS